MSERDALKRENEGAAKAIRRLQSVIHVDGAEVAAESGLVSLSSSLTALEAACRPVVSSEV